MAKKTTFYVTDPSGVVHKRTSESKVYTHCTLGAYYPRRPRGPEDPRFGPPMPRDRSKPIQWYAFRWSQSAKNAQAAVAEVRRHWADYDWEDLLVVEATTVKPKVK